MFSWSYLFSDDTLEMGKSYYDSVSDVRCIDNRISAVVRGTVDYFVCVTLNNNQIKSVECNCYNDAKCKHMVALLHYIEDNEHLLDNRKSSYVNMLYSLDIDGLRQLLTSLLDDGCCQEKIKAFLDEKSVDKRFVLKKLKHLMQVENPYYEGVISGVLSFIDYDIYMLYKRGEYDFTADLLNIIADEYLTGHGDINYNSEDMLSARYLSYSKHLLEKEEVSEINKKKINEYRDRIYGYF